jgi:hypothetical protein
MAVERAHAAGARTRGVRADAVLLEDEDAPAAFREMERGGETVQPAADDDRIETHASPASSRCTAAGSGCSPAREASAASAASGTGRAGRRPTRAPR